MHAISDLQAENTALAPHSYNRTELQKHTMLEKIIIILTFNTSNPSQTILLNHQADWFQS